MTITTNGGGFTKAELITENCAEVIAEITSETPDNWRITIDSWFFNREDLQELKAFIDVLDEELKRRGA